MKGCYFFAGVHLIQDWDYPCSLIPVSIATVLSVEGEECPLLMVVQCGDGCQGSDTRSPQCMKGRGRDSAYIAQGREGRQSSVHSLYGTWWGKQRGTAFILFHSGGESKELCPTKSSFSQSLCKEAMLSCSFKKIFFVLAFLVYGLLC